MPKVGCKCGYIFNLSYFPLKESYEMISVVAIIEIAEYMNKNGWDQDKFDKILDKGSAFDVLFCPQCKRLLLIKDSDEKYESYVKEEE